MVQRTWSLREAKNRFGEVVAAARRKPQVVTENGKPLVVVMTADEYEKLRALERAKAPSFAKMLLAMPQGDVEFERLNAALRDVEF